MRRILHHVAQRAGLDDTAGIHHGHAVADLDRDADVVGDEDHRHAELALELAQQQEDLDLHGGIERGGGLVGQQHLRPAGERERDHRALAHAAGHFVRIGIEPAARRGDAHALEHVECALARLRRAHAFVADHGLGDLLADGVDRIEREHRLLKDHRDGAPAHALERGFIERQHVLAGDLDRAGDHAALRRQHAQQGAQRHALAGAGFAEQAEHLALGERDVDAVDRMHRALAGEPDAQVADIDDRTHGALGARR